MSNNVNAISYIVIDMAGD